ncbi:MAG: Tn3 family transposase [Chloracidobacterium sp.]|nr:Tn3 family transposase [Chloracidobacterium sp.]
MLALAGSVKLGVVQATSVMRIQVGDRPAKLAQAAEEYGRIDKTIHCLTYVDELERRRTLTQLIHGDGSPQACPRRVPRHARRITSTISRRPGRSALGARAGHQVIVL